MKPCIVLLPIEYNDRKAQAEWLEGSKSDDFDAILNAHGCINALVYNLTDFMDACNDEMIDLNRFWVSYIYEVEENYNYDKD